MSHAELTDDTVARLVDLLARHGVMILPGQHLDDESFVALLTRFGELTFTTGETPVAGFADLNVVTNVGRTTPPRSTFHVDTSYVRQPPAYTALRARHDSRQGRRDALHQPVPRLSTPFRAEVRTRLEGRTIRHVATGVELSEDDESSAEHPAFRRHPVSGRTALYLSTPTRCVAISGMPAAEAAEMIDLLYEHSTSEDNTLRHAWSPGDVVLWDNGCVLHRADHADVVGDRVMHRGMIAAYPDRRPAAR